MKMEYKLLNGNSGVIMTRTPELVSDMLYISFAGAPEKATAIFERDDGESAYKALSDGLCGIESDWLNDSTKVTVAVLDGSMRSQRWFCEGFCAKRLTDCGAVLIYPDDMDMQKKIAKLQEEVSDLTTVHKKLSDKYSELETKLNKLLEGYDIV
jgi:hypothetical protein